LSPHAGPGADGKLRAYSAVLLIGNELLSGRVRDENLPFLASELWELGAPVRTVRVVRDELDEIAEAVRELSAGCSFVFTTGGIGPTHDDVTVEGIARGFEVDVVVHPDLEALIRGRVQGQPDASHLRMARVPHGARLVGGGEGAWPTISIENVFILPGIPSVLRRKFRQIRELFRQPPLYRETLVLATEETTIAGILQSVASRIPAVEIGSYPQSDRVLITFEGEDRSEVQRAYDAVDSASSGIPRA
jgi:molybdenum cofactor synthesis domain-containing protein